MSTQLLNWINSPLPLQPLYSVTGQEGFFISEIKKTMIKIIHSGNGAADFNHDEVSADEIAVEELIALLETLPLMSEKRLIFCDRAEKFQEKDWEKLFSVFSEPLENVVLVCFFEKKDGRKKHFKFLKENSVELSAEPLKSWELEPWLHFLACREGLVFSMDSKALFSHLVGTNLMEVQIELKKLKQYIGADKQVSEKAVLACTSRLKTESIFELTDAIGKKDVVQALNSLACLLGQNQNEIGALAMLARHIRILSKLKLGEKKKLSKAQLAHKAGVSTYFLKNYMNQTKLWSEQQIHQALSALLSVDKALKSSPISSHIWLESFILKVCS